MLIDQPSRQAAQDLTTWSGVKHEAPSAVDDITEVLVTTPAVRRTTAIWSPAADLNNVDAVANVKTSAAVSPSSGLTPFTPLSAAAAAAFLHPKGTVY